MKSLIRAALIPAVSVLAAVGFAAPAQAHVKVSGVDATPGGYGVLTFRVPTESETASTTELRVILPQTTPIYVADTQAKPGWTANVVMRDLATPQTDRDGKVHHQYAAEVDWKADTPAAAIKPHQFDTFNISVGPLPQQPSLALPAEQFYSDGTTVAWDQASTPGQPEPDHPAPVLTFAGNAPPDVAITEQTTESVADGTPVWPAVLALVLGVVALAAALGNFVLLRRSTTTSK